MKIDAILKTSKLSVLEVATQIPLASLCIFCHAMQCAMFMCKCMISMRKCSYVVHSKPMYTWLHLFQEDPEGDRNGLASAILTQKDTWGLFASIGTNHVQDSGLANGMAQVSSSLVISPSVFLLFFTSNTQVCTRSTVSSCLKLMFPSLRLLRSLEKF